MPRARNAWSVSATWSSGDATTSSGRSACTSPRLIHTRWPSGLSAWSWEWGRSEEHTSELQSQSNLVCRLLLEKKKKQKNCSAAHIHCHRICETAKYNAALDA